MRTGAPRRRLTDDAIIDRIMAAIVEHRLPPGTKLGEDRLGEVFGVSRTRIRQVLLRLAAEKVVTQIANRGAFVAQPTVQEAREVFDARRAVEAELVARVAAQATDAQVRRLREHLARERAVEEA
ncbi:MAG: GntR family transcriptional regulator, partial [Burkholderiales bacterium]|nr:GntR family transcriptional regulator [Burkholderiales bacterium]